MQSIRRIVAIIKTAIKPITPCMFAVSDSASFVRRFCLVDYYTPSLMPHTIHLQADLIATTPVFILMTLLPRTVYKVCNNPSVHPTERPLYGRDKSKCNASAGTSIYPASSRRW